jgi:hypothetical protein
MISAAFSRHSCEAQKHGDVKIEKTHIEMNSIPKREAGITADVAPSF